MANPPHVLHEQDIRKVVRDETGPKEAFLKAILENGQGGLYVIGDAFKAEFDSDRIMIQPGVGILAFDNNGEDSHFVSSLMAIITTDFFIPNTSDHDRHDNVGVVFDEDGLTYTIQVIPGDESTARPFVVRFQPPTTWDVDYSLNLTYTVNESTDPGQVGSQLQMTPGWSNAEMQAQFDGTNTPLTVSGDWPDFTITSTENHHLSAAALDLYPEFYDSDPQVTIIDKGSIGYGDLITDVEAGIERFFQLADVTNYPSSSSWGDTGTIDKRYVLHPSGLWTGGEVTGDTWFSGDLTKSNKNYDSIFYARSAPFPEDDSAGFGSGQTRDNRPTIDISAITDPTLQSIAQGLADFGIIRDANA